MGEIIRDIILYIVVIGGIGAFLFLVGYRNYKERKDCYIPVRGIFVDVRTVTRRNTIYKYGIFEYQYQGQFYRNSSIDNIAGRRGRNFHIGAAYEIYINPQKPKRPRCLNKLWTANDITAILAGIYFLGLSFVGVLGKILMAVGVL